MRNIFYYVLLCFLIFTSCEQQNTTKSNNNQAIEIIEADKVDEEEIKEVESDIQQAVIETGFSEFDFTIFNSSFYENKVISINSDTVNTYLELGENLDSASIEIHHSGIYDIDIYQMHENSITINNEGPHCDLVNWKHYYSDWTTVKKYNNYDFVTDKYLPTDYSLFIEADIKDMQNAVLEHCGEEWTDNVANVTTFYDYPCNVAMSKIFFKIILTHLETGEITQHIVVFEIPMGC